MAQAQRIVQQLTIHLTGGQSVKIRFNAEKPDVFNFQIQGFLIALNDRNKQNCGFVFEGANVVFVRISEVIAAEARSFVCSTSPASSSSPENAPYQGEKQLLANDSEPVEKTRKASVIR